MTTGYCEVEKYDDWLKDGSEVAALVVRQYLVPVQGRDAVIFPPTYPVKDDSGSSEAGYNIDRFSDGSSVCQIDSVGSQANRMEPVFNRQRYKHLVPQVAIEAGDRRINLLVEAGHRAADAIVRFSTLGPQLHEAFRVYRDEGDAAPLARIAPTSLVFGAWDSRATQVKLPRIVRAVVRAYNVKELTRSAQYSTIAGEILAQGDAEVTTKGPKAELGLAHVPAVKTHGGVQLENGGEIRREGIINLAALRALGGSSDEETLQIRRYVLGLALVSLTAPLGPSLREGCELVPDPDRKSTWRCVKHDGTRSDEGITHNEALDFATAAATTFQVTTEPIRATFSSDLANRVLSLSEADRKKLLRQGPVTAEAIEKLVAKSNQADNFEAAIKMMKIDELRAECEKRGLSMEGKKSDLVQRLTDAHAAHIAGDEKHNDESGEDTGIDEDGRTQE
ncbi:MAG: type I-U CRISPR-associated RAMP protein Csb1/Cas7u [Acidobacteriota bacterium]